jgi:hypothetical protein
MRGQRSAFAGGDFVLARFVAGSFVGSEFVLALFEGGGLLSSSCGFVFFHLLLCVLLLCICSPSCSHPFLQGHASVNQCVGPTPCEGLLRPCPLIAKLRTIIF